MLIVDSLNYYHLTTLVLEATLFSLLVANYLFVSRIRLLLQTGTVGR